MAIKAEIVWKLNLQEVDWGMASLFLLIKELLLFRLFKCMETGVIIIRAQRIMFFQLMFTLPKLHLTAHLNVARNTPFLPLILKILKYNITKYY